MGVGRTAVVHRDAVEPGGAERLAVRGDFLEVPAERLLALVEAGDDLEPRRGGFPRAVQGQCVERLGAEPRLVGEVEHAPPLDVRETPRSLRRAIPRHPG